MRTGFTGRRIDPPDAPHHHNGPQFTADERSFMVAAARRGLTDLEVTRQFFRRFGRDVSEATVRRLRST